MTEKKKKTKLISFSVVLFAVVVLFALSVFNNRAYNQKRHQASFSGSELMQPEGTEAKGISVRISPRSGTWTRDVDLYGEGITEHNFQAYTFDFYLTNTSRDQISDYTFTFTFDTDTLLLSAWNGALELHQNRPGRNYVTTVPDLREFEPEKYDLTTVESAGDIMVWMRKGDSLRYIPGTSGNAKELPIDPDDGVVPGLIMYLPIGQEIENETLAIEYVFHRELTREPLFWAASIGFLIWVIGLIISILTEVQIKKYAVQHEHDNHMIEESIETFISFIDAKDPYTHGHSNRVAHYTRLIAKEMGYEGEDLGRIYYIALLHDCGKIGVPDNILSKPGKLTDEEFQVIKSHTSRGAEILRHFKSLEQVEEGALYHHERYDGRGYPEGKKGDEIPLIARMICVADAFDAMNSNRVYRKKLTKEDILDELEKNKGTQFDPKIADILLHLIKNGTIDMS